MAAIIARAWFEHEPVDLMRLGRRVAAVNDADDLDESIELDEDLADIRAVEESHAEMIATGELRILWKHVKSSLVWCEIRDHTLAFSNSTSSKI